MVTISLKEFPFHMPYTDNKKAANKYVKLNYQTIYNGKINRFARAILMDNLHKYIISQIPKGLVVTNFPVRIKYTIRTVINHGGISRRGGKLIWKYPSEHHVPEWDIENLANIWIKAGNDALSIRKVIPDDNVSYVLGTAHEFEQVDDIKNREIVIQIY